MLQIVLLVFVVLFLAFIVYVATRDGRFRYERSGVILASPEKIYPYLSHLKLGAQWSPYERKDPKLKTKIIGPEDQVGGVMEFDGNRDVGSGKIEILRLVPNREVDLRLIMVKPFPADNLVEYRLTAESSGTRFTWTMSGNAGFFGKLAVVMIDCEKMVGDQFLEGIENLKLIVENKL